MRGDDIDLASDSGTKTSSSPSHGSHHPSFNSDYVGMEIILISDGFVSERISRNPLEEHTSSFGLSISILLNISRRIDRVEALRPLRSCSSSN